MAKETLLLQSSNNDIQTINGVTYFKLTPGFSGDTTKNCGLTGDEVDKNFYFLRGYDIESVELDEQNNLVITRIDKNYEPIVINLGGEDGNPRFELDSDTGTLIVTYPDETEVKVEGFLTDISNATVFTDETLVGNGNQSNKLGLSPVEKTGTYSPVESFIDISDGNDMPDATQFGAGYRILTKEATNIYGYRYPYSALEIISSELNNSNSEWRIPTKEDWDDLLNAFECDADRNHSGLTEGYYGRVAGIALKASDEEGGWKPSSQEACGNNTSGLFLLPIGGSDDVHHAQNNESMFGYYWTSSSDNENSIYMKIFSYNTGQVYQEKTPNIDNYCRGAIRLVKDYQYNSFSSVENILGGSYPVKLVNGIHDDYPYAKLWTNINLYYTNDDLVGLEEVQLSGLTFSDNLFCVCEWNGKTWIKKAMNEGDTIVIKDNNYTEYMLKNGVLVSSINDVKQSVNDVKTNVNDVKNRVDDVDVEINDIIDAINEIQNSVDITNETINEFSGSVYTQINDGILGSAYTLTSSSEMVLRRKNNNNDIKLKISDDFFDFGVITH